jgi:hypothetical protein
LIRGQAVGQSATFEETASVKAVKAVMMGIILQETAEAVVEL